MKIKNLILVAALALTTTVTFAQKKVLNAKNSSIEWVGKKVTGAHNGTLQFTSGSLTLDGDRITAGEFVVDMTSITVTDLEGNGKTNLEGHLKSTDFFGTDNHKTAKLVIKKAKKDGDVYKVSGDLTIKDKTNPITFELALNGNKATSSLKVDRTKYGIRYGSGSFFENLGDKAINDEFELNVNINF